jgi:hypothetical protein
MISWPDGEIRAPDGGEIMREVPQRHVWSSSVWCSKTGLLWRRYYNSQVRTWKWDDKGPMQLVEEADTGRMGIHLEWFVTVEHAIAMAWLLRAPGSTVGVERDLSERLHARHLQWGDGGECHEEEEGPITGEVFRPLKWKCGVVPCDPRYQISNMGRLRSPHTGLVTSGFAYGDTRLAACRGAGLVDLHRAGRRCRDIVVPPRIMMGIDALSTGHDPHDLACEADISEKTAWGYMTQAAQHIPGAELRRLVPRLVSSELWRALRDMQEEGHPLLGARLLDLIEEVMERVSSRGEYAQSDFQMEELRLARLALMA